MAEREIFRGKLYCRRVRRELCPGRGGVADSQPLSQQLYAPGGFHNSRHPLLTKAEHLVRYQNPSISVEALAEALNMTTRTLHRKMMSLNQESPKSFITRVRIETAHILLESPLNTISQVASACGYKDETAPSMASWKCLQTVTGKGSTPERKGFEIPCHEFGKQEYLTRNED